MEFILLNSRLSIGLLHRPCLMNRAFKNKKVWRNLKSYLFYPKLIYMVFNTLQFFWPWNMQCCYCAADIRGNFSVSCNAVISHYYSITTHGHFLSPQILEFSHKNNFKCYLAFYLVLSTSAKLSRYFLKGI